MNRGLSGSMGSPLRTALQRSTLVSGQVIKTIPCPPGLTKHIKSERDVDVFAQGSVYRAVLDWCDRVSNACSGQTTVAIIDRANTSTFTQDCPSFLALMNVLQEVHRLIDEAKPDLILQPSAPQPQASTNRTYKWMAPTLAPSPGVINPDHVMYGDPSYREFIDRVHERLPIVLEETLGQHYPRELIQCLQGYLMISFGEQTRIDYGTGHELNFVCALLCLEQTPDNAIRSNLDLLYMLIFKEYTQVIQRLIQAFRLQPAGSKGCWGLDDYFHIPFIIGSAQLVNSNIDTNAVNHPNQIDQHLEESVYLEMIHYISKTKYGRDLSENARMLYDISGVPTWSQINVGLIKMYQQMVLQKYPVVQHFHFSKYLPWEGSIDTKAPQNASIQIKRDRARLPPLPPRT